MFGSLWVRGLGLQELRVFDSAGDLLFRMFRVPATI